MGPYKKVCEYCGKEFTARNITERFCCSDCRESYHKEEKKEYKNVCDYCGKEFIANSKNVKYCSDECRKNARNEKLKYNKKICDYCGKEFIPTEITQRFCCDNCRQSFHREKIKEIKNICKNCGKEFITTNNKVKYCSDKCRKEHRKNNKKNIHKVCEYCGTEYIAHSNKSKYCSTKCKSRATDKRSNGKYQQCTCECCGKEYIGYYNSKFCGLKCRREISNKKMRQKHIDEREELFDKNSKEGYDYVICPICNAKFKQITMQHFSNVHGITDRLKLFQMYPNLQMTCQRMIDENLKGDNNPMSSANTTEEERKRSSPYSLEHYLYSKGAKTEEEAIEMRQKFLDSLDRSNWENANRIEYYLKRGYTEEEAYRIRTKKCTTNGLDFYIEKYGEEEGTKKFNNRLKYWKHKIYNGNHHSKTADKFFLKLSELYDKKDNIYFGNHEYMLTYEGKVILPDFLDVDKKKIIEFYGDYWHCNPNKYTSESYNKSLHKYTKEIWDKDKERVNSLNTLGYDVLIIWESEYKNNNDEIINKCLNFLCE